MLFCWLAAACMIVVTGLWLFGVGLLMACDLLQKKERKQAFVYRTNILKKIPWKACIFSKEKEYIEP